MPVLFKNLPQISLHIVQDASKLSFMTSRGPCALSNEVAACGQACPSCKRCTTELRAT